jgi:hypothetical protein
VLAGTKQRFLAWGVNYDHDEAQRLLEDYWVSEWGKVIEDFREIKALGANVVRVHLQVGKFMTSAQQANPAALEQYARLVRLAEAEKLYLDVTGLGCYHKHEVPGWYDSLSEAERWNTQARFWEAVAKVGASSPAIFCYDLMNEPLLPGADKPETEWLAGEFAGKYFVQRIALELRERKPEAVAKAWVDTLAGAIRKQDTRHLLTVGIIPWAQVFPGAKPVFYGDGASKALDFVSVHFYPRRGEREKTLKALEVYRVGLPLVIEEVFPLNCGVDELDRFVDGSRPMADGWIGFYWGKTSEAYSLEKTNLASVLTRDWLEYFKRKGPEILEKSR